MRTITDSTVAHSFFEECKKVGNLLLGPAYFFGAHWYDAFCGYISNEFSYLSALLIMFVFLFSISVLLVFGHAFFEKKFKWDLMGLREFNADQQRDYPWWRVFKQLKKWMTKNRRTTFWVGNVLVGPPITTVLLRKQDNRKENFKYIASGTIISVFFWVSSWAGIGMFTWEQYIKPFLGLQ